MSICGSYSAYVAGCRCVECRAASNAYATRRRAAIRRPDEVWLSSLVPAGPTRARLAELLERHTVNDLWRRTGIHRDQLRRIRDGLTRQVSRKTRDTLEALVPSGEGGRWARPGDASATPRTLEQVQRDAAELDELYLELAVIVEERREPWRRRAACRGPGVSVSAFFAPRGASIEPARELCGRCPVVQECGRYADERFIEAGLWGGAPHKERRAGRHVAEAG